MEANVLPDVSKITFENGLTKIFPTTNLPPLSAGNTHIDGEGLISIVGNQVSEPNYSYGLQILNSSYNIIQGLNIRRFDFGIGILADEGEEAKNNTIGLLQNEAGDTTQRNILILNSTGLNIQGQGALK